MATFDILHKYGPDWRLIFVGDAAMSPYELVQAGGSVEYANDEPGVAWLKRLMDAYRRRHLAQSGTRACVDLHALHSNRPRPPRPAHVFR